MKSCVVSLEFPVSLILSTICFVMRFAICWGVLIHKTSNSEEGAHMTSRTLTEKPTHRCETCHRWVASVRPWREKHRESPNFSAVTKHVLDCFGYFTDNRVLTTFLGVAISLYILITSGLAYRDIKWCSTILCLAEFSLLYSQLTRTVRTEASCSFLFLCVGLARLVDLPIVSWQPDTWH